MKQLLERYTRAVAQGKQAEIFDKMEGEEPKGEMSLQCDWSDTGVRVRTKRGWFVATQKG